MKKLKFLNLIVLSVFLFGCGGGGKKKTADEGPDRNYIVNAGFENTLVGWTTDNGLVKESDPAPNHGELYLYGAEGGPTESYTFQVVDLVSSGLDVSKIDNGEYSVYYGGWQSGWGNQTDSGRIEISQYDVNGELVAETNMSWFYSNNTWTKRDNTIALEPSVRTVRYAFRTKKQPDVGVDVDAYLDDAFLHVRENL